MPTGRGFMRKLMEVEIKALEDLTRRQRGVVRWHRGPAGSCRTSEPADADGKAGRADVSTSSRSISRTPAVSASGRARPLLRKRGELREFLEIAGDKPVNAYRQADGVNFKDVQLALPDLSSKAALQRTDARRRGQEGIRAASRRRARRASQSDHHQRQDSERSRCSSNGQSRGTAASSTRSRTSASSFQEQAQRQEAPPLDHRGTQSHVRRADLHGLPVGASLAAARQCRACANRQSTGCRSLPCSRVCGWARSSRCRSPT